MLCIEALITPIEIISTNIDWSTKITIRHFFMIFFPEVFIALVFLTKLLLLD